MEYTSAMHGICLYYAWNMHEDLHVHFVGIIESVDSISRDALRAGKLLRFLTFIFMILSRIPIYQAQKHS